MEKICDKEPIAILEITRKEIKNEESTEKLKEFIENVQKG